MATSTRAPARPPVQRTSISGSRQSVPLGGDRQLSRSGGQLGYTAPGRSVTVQAPGKTYHRIILAEFVACMMLTVAAPIFAPATKTGGDGKAAVDDTVSLAGTLVRLTAICILFFVLALAAAGPRTGRIAAALGGLVTAGAFLTATSIWAAIGDAFGVAVKSKTTASATASGSGTPVYPTPTGAPPAGLLPGAG